MEEKVQGHREGQKIELGNFLLHVVFMQFDVNVISFLWNKGERGSILESIKAYVWKLWPSSSVSVYEDKWNHQQFLYNKRKMGSRSDHRPRIHNLDWIPNIQLIF